MICRTCVGGVRGAVSREGGRVIVGCRGASDRTYVGTREEVCHRLVLRVPTREAGWLNGAP
ncbi:hypothetical protein MICRO116_810049 [Micrococcus sp. 116]|nr:hypothetical protein MICRO116_810049 [Micrococcus sp. 116]